MPSPLVEIIDLKKYYPCRHRFWSKPLAPVRAVDGVSLQIFPGETVALVGKSGSGKTTLMHCLFRIITPTAGRIFFNGADVWSLAGENLNRFRRQAQFIFQDAEAALNPRLPVGRAIAEPLLAHRLLERKTAFAQARALLHAVGLNECYCEALPGALSCGQRHRVVIARALALQPKFIVADEPFSSLDVLNKSRLLDLFISLRDQFSLTYFFISHDLSLVNQWCNRIAVMQEGKIVEIKARTPDGNQREI